ncbi:hypothetical protein K438DRAFT_2026038, partial [Mycena galopus ATCC 62051]
MTLATSIPQIFNHIPNPFQIQVPAAAISTNVPVLSSSSQLLPPTLNQPPLLPPTLNVPPPLVQGKFPLVKYWDYKDYKDNAGANSDLTVISDEKEPKLDFLEHADGSPFSDTDIAGVRRHIRGAFESLLRSALAPPTWRKASSVAVNWLRAEMLGYCPDLGLCSHYWKINSVATEVYSQWSRKYRLELQPPEPMTLKRKSGSNAAPDSSISTQKSKKSKTASHNTPATDALAKPKANITKKTRKGKESEKALPADSSSHIRSPSLPTGALDITDISPSDPFTITSLSLDPTPPGSPQELTDVGPSDPPTSLLSFAPDAPASPLELPLTVPFQLAESAPDQPHKSASSSSSRPHPSTIQPVSSQSQQPARNMSSPGTISPPILKITNPLLLGRAGLPHVSRIKTASKDVSNTMSTTT